MDSQSTREIKQQNETLIQQNRQIIELLATMNSTMQKINDNFNLVASDDLSGRKVLKIINTSR